MKTYLIAITLLVGSTGAQAFADPMFDSSDRAETVRVAQVEGQNIASSDICTNDRAYLPVDADSGPAGFVKLADIENGEGVRVISKLPAHGCVMEASENGANDDALYLF